MPTYDFIDPETSESFEVYYDSIADAPDVGDKIEHEGRTLVRVWDPVGQRAPTFHVKGGAFVSQSLPPVVDSDGELTGHWDPETVKYVKDKTSDDYGQPIVEGKKDIQTLEKESDGKYKFDPHS